MGNEIIVDPPKYKKESRRDKLSREMEHKAPPKGLSNQELLDTGAISMSAIPIAGDIAGLAADANMFWNDPESRTLGNFALSGLGVLPWIPNASGALRVVKKAVKGKFSRTTTDMPYYDDLIKAHDSQYKTEYFRDQKGVESRMVDITPDEYLNTVDEGFVDGGVMIGIDDAKVKRYAKKLEDGETFPALTLDYARGKKLSQEGRHRALAAKMVGIDSVPVLVVTPTPEADLLPRHVMNVKTASGKKISVVQNPSHGDLYGMIKEAGQNGDGSLRKTMDLNGNTYWWDANQAMHSDVEPNLSKLLGAELNQNGYFDSK